VPGILGRREPLRVVEQRHRLFDDQRQGLPAESGVRIGIGRVPSRPWR
jgi:hypothetical protein